MTAVEESDLDRKKRSTGDALMRRVLIGFLLFAALASSVVVYKHRADTGDAATIDGTDYDALATSIMTKGTYDGQFVMYGGSYSYDSSFRAPGYPAFLALVYTIAGHRFVAVYAAQAVLFVATLLLVYLIVFSITALRSQAVIAAGLCAIWPLFYVDLVPTVLTEMLAAFLIAASLLCVIAAREKPELGFCIMSGLVLGAATLTKATFLPFALLAPLFIAFGGRDRKQRIGFALIVLAAACSLIVPWCVRNYRMEGGFVPVTTGGGLNAWLGNNPELSHMIYTQMRVPAVIDGVSLSGKTSLEKDRFLMADAMRRVRKHPGRAAGLVAMKLLQASFGGLGMDPRASYKPIPAIGHFGFPRRSFASAILNIAAIIGWFLLPGAARRRAYPLLLLLGTWTLSYAATIVVVRYSYPIQFYFLAFAGVSLHRVLLRFQRLRPVLDLRSPQNV